MAPLKSKTNFTEKNERRDKSMKRQGKDAKDAELIELLLKRGVYLESAFPYLPKGKVLKPKVTKILSQMLPGERILAARRMAIMAKYLDVIQLALSELEPV